MSRWSVGTVAMRAEEAAPSELLPSAIMALAPVAYWKMEEEAGPTAVDATGHGHTGVYTAAVAFGDRVGAFGRPVPNFWKTTSQVDVPNSALFSPPNDITVACLAQQTSALIGSSPSGFVSFAKGTNFITEWAASWPSFHSFAANGNTTSGVYWATEHIGIALGPTFGWYVWQFPASDVPRIYVNNVGPLGTTGDPNGTRQGASGLSLRMGTGGGNLTSHSPIKGRFMCHAVLWDRLLTSDEMTDLYAAKVADGW